MEPDDRAFDDPAAEDCERGLAQARALAQKIVLGEGDLAKLANGIYWAGWLNGGFAGPSDDPVCPALTDVAGEFVQLGYALEHPANEESERGIVALTRKAAEAFLEGRPLPEWPDEVHVKF